MAGPLGKEAPFAGSFLVEGRWGGSFKNRPIPPPTSFRSALLESGWGGSRWMPGNLANC